MELMKHNPVFAHHAFLTAGIIELPLMLISI